MSFNFTLTRVFGIAKSSKMEDDQRKLATKAAGSVINHRARAAVFTRLRLGRAVFFWPFVLGPFQSVSGVRKRAAVIGSAR